MSAVTGLVGRDRPIAILRDLVGGLRSRGAALVLRGEPGIGKSAVLSAAVADAVAGETRVLSATGTEPESHLSFAGLHQLLAPVLETADALPGPQRHAIHAAFGLADALGPDLFLIALATLNLLAEVASAGPLLLVVDDAHWLDRASADVLGFVARRLDAEPIGMLLAARDGYPQVRAVAGIAELRLERLPDDAAGTLLDARSPGLGAAARAGILTAAAGNPLALVELPSLAGELDVNRLWLPVTTRLEQAFSDRIETLEPAAGTALRMAALNDGDALAETLAATAVVEGRPVGADTLEPAIAANLILVEGGRIRFRHPLVRSAIHQSIPAVRRPGLHAALSEVLAAHPERRVWHRAAASTEPDEEIAAGLDAAARAAHRRGAVAGAADLLEHAARLSTDENTRAERLLRAAELYTETGPREQIDRLLALIDGHPLTPAQQARTAWVRGRFYSFLAEGSAGVRSLVSYANAATDRGETGLALHLLYAASLACSWSEPQARVRHEVTAAAGRVLAPADDPRLLLVLAYGDPVAAGEPIVSRVRAVAARGNLDPATGVLLATAANAIGEHDLCLELIGPALTGLRTAGQLGAAGRALVIQTRSAANLAELSLGLPAVEEAIRLARETSSPAVEALALAEHAQLAALRGRYDEVEASATEAERIAVPLRATAVLATVQHARGLAALAAGRPREAFDQLLRVYRPGDPAYHPLRRYDAIADLAEAAARSGRAGDVRDILSEMEDVVGRLRTRLPAVALRHANAVLSGDFDSALAASSEAPPFARARLHLAYGERLRRNRRRADSRPHLRSARDAFDALGALPWGERARHELRAAGETSGSRSPGALDRLTPQELQIAQLAADGLTNREIGLRLYVSHRTVSTHLHRIFPKLGVTARSALRDALG